MEINGAFPAANMNQDGTGWLLTRVVFSAITLGDVPDLVNHRAAGNGQVHPQLPAAGVGSAMQAAWYGSRETCLSSPAVRHLINKTARNPKKKPWVIDLRRLID